MKIPLFLETSIKELINLYQLKKISPVDIANLCIKYYEQTEPLYSSWTSFDAEKLLQQAQLSEQRIQKGEKLRDLEGIPVGVKDIFNTIDFKTEMGSPLWQNFTPGNDARTVFYLKQNGGLIPGKTVTAEFAVHTLGKTLNPHNPLYTPGTSSSGSAVAVATGVVPVALGTQTAGSIIRPASFCGVYGIKPSFGLIPRTGLLKTTDSLDTVGYFVSHFEDIERIFNVLRVHGSNYPISDSILNNHKRQNKQPNKPWRIGIAKTHTWDLAENYAQEALLKFANTLSQDHNVHVTEAQLPLEMEQAHEIHATIYNKTLSYYFKKEFQKSQLISPIMNDLIRQGQKISVQEYQQALVDQIVLEKKMDALFNQYDILISLSTAGQAPLRDIEETRDPALMWTMTHLSVISAPVFQSPQGLPFGVQIVARRYNDPLLFKFAEYLRLHNYIPAGANPLHQKLQQLDLKKSPNQINTPVFDI